MFRLLDAFAGIGGFSLGLEATGFFETVAFCENESYPRRVIGRHWPGIPIHDDIRTLAYSHAEKILFDQESGNEIIRGTVDVISGGFPCTDVSLAGQQAGIDGKASGLWNELARLIGDIRPRYAIVENVSALLSGDRGRWFGRVLGDLAALGYDAEWHCLPASAFNAPHRRDRVWLIAYPSDTDAERVELRNESGRERRPSRESSAEPRNDGAKKSMADAEVESERPGLCESEPSGERRRRSGDGGREGTVPDADRSVERRRVEPERRPDRRDAEPSRDGEERSPRRTGDIPDADETRSPGTRREKLRPTQGPRQSCETLADTGRERRDGIGESEHAELESPSGRKPDRRGSGRRRDGETLADASGARGETRLSGSDQRQKRDSGITDYVSDVLRGARPERGMEWWTVEPDIRRVAHGVPARVHRLKCLGNAIVPQIALVLGNAIAYREGLIE